MSVKEKPRIASAGGGVNLSNTRKYGRKSQKTQSPRVRIYFAGKIGKDDWRTQLFGDRIGGVDDGELFDPGADCIFAYLDSFTAYGTLVEIGYAYASGIPIVVALSPSLKWCGNTGDLWYAIEAARLDLIGTPRHTFAKLCKAIGLSWRHRSARHSATENTGPSLFGVHPGGVPWLR